MDYKNSRRRQIDIENKAKLLKAAYVSSLTLLFLLMVFTPYLVGSGLFLRARLIVGEEIAEGVLIALLLLAGYFASIVYKKEFDKYARELEELAAKKDTLENELNEAFCYIGAVNVQLLEIKSVLTGQKRYPESKRDFKKIESLFARQALGIANVDWVVLRIVNPETLRTLQEHSEARGKARLRKHNISNKAVVSNEAVADYSVVTSEQENLTIKAFCILPTKELAESQQILIRAIVSELEMLFILLRCEYYKEGFLKKKSRQEFVQGVRWSSKKR
jgi:hypothetical protein